MHKVIISLLISTLLACEFNPPPQFTPSTPGPGDTPDIEIVNSLFNEGEEPGQITFETNDPENWSSQGTAIWFVLDEQQPTFPGREVQLSKLSGDQTAGYGLVYCYRDDPVYKETMLAILINTRKEYIVAEIIDNAFKEVLPWTESSFLLAGYNQRNTLRLEYSTDDGNFDLYINDQLETTFRDDTAPIHTGGQDGYMVIISSQDDFPETMVKVQFTEITE